MAQQPVPYEEYDRLREVCRQHYVETIQLERQLRLLIEAAEAALGCCELEAEYKRLVDRIETAKAHLS